MNIRGSSGYTALHWVADNGFIEAARALLRAPTLNCNIKTDKGNTPLIISAKLDTQQLSRCSGVIRPSSKRRAECRLCSLHTVCSVNIRGSSGYTALHWAARKGFVEIARALLRAPTLDCNIKNDKGNTPLLLAALEGHSGVIEELCRHPSIE